MARATAFLALAFGLSASAASAATPAGPTAPPDNPFEERGGESPSGAGDKPAAAESNGDSAPEQEEQEQEQEQEQGAQSESEPGAESQDETEAESNLHGLACLEGDATGGRRKGVQRRDFLKRHRFELGALGGYYASDALSSTYILGGALAYYPSEDFGLELLVTRTPIRFRLEEPFNAFDLERHFQGGVAWQGIGSLLWSPIHAKFKFSDSTIIHGDIFALAGFGRTFHESVLGLTWEAGFGLKLYLSRYLTLRLDLRDFLLPQEVLGRGRTTNNITAMGGVSVWLL